jgi:hypothetical protein
MAQDPCRDDQTPGHVIVTGVKVNDVLRGETYLADRKSMPKRDVPPPAK